MRGDFVLDAGDAARQLVDLGAVGRDGFAQLFAGFYLSVAAAPDFGVKGFNFLFYAVF